MRRVGGECREGASCTYESIDRAKHVVGEPRSITCLEKAKNWLEVDDVDGELGVAGVLAIAVVLDHQPVVVERRLRTHSADDATAHRHPGVPPGLSHRWSKLTTEDAEVAEETIKQIHSACA